MKFNSSKYRQYLGDSIRLLRSNKSKSQEDLAELISRDRSYISQIENGHNITINVLVDISQALGITPCKLLKITERRYKQYESKS